MKSTVSCLEKSLCQRISSAHHGSCGKYGQQEKKENLFHENSGLKVDFAAHDVVHRDITVRFLRPLVECGGFVMVDMAVGKQHIGSQGGGARKRRSCSLPYSGFRRSRVPDRLRRPGNLRPAWFWRYFSTAVLSPEDNLSRLRNAADGTRCHAMQMLHNCMRRKRHNSTFPRARSLCKVCFWNTAEYFFSY